MSHLTKQEKALFLAFLDELDEVFSNAGCNDYSLPNTTENYKIMERMIKFNFSGEEQIEELNHLAKTADQDELCTMDVLLFNYLRSKVERSI